MVSIDFEKIRKECPKAIAAVYAHFNINPTDLEGISHEEDGYIKFIWNSSVNLLIDIRNLYDFFDRNWLFLIPDMTEIDESNDKPMFCTGWKDRLSYFNEVEGWYINRYDAECAGFNKLFYVLEERL